MTKEIATFGMGCFWKPDLIFSEIKGVSKVTVGFMGGDEKKFPNPTYRQVCWRKTGYAEVVNIEFENKKINYEKLLELFWENHNPTTKNRQGFDIGAQYRSVIFYYSSSQRKKAEASLKEHQEENDKKIVTQINKAKTFFGAEDYHQDYLKKRGKKTC